MKYYPRMVKISFVIRAVVDIKRRKAPEKKTKKKKITVNNKKKQR